MQPPRSRPIGAGDRTVARPEHYETSQVREWQRGEYTVEDPAAANKRAREVRAANQAKQNKHFERCPKLARTS